MNPRLLNMNEKISFRKWEKKKTDALKIEIVCYNFFHFMPNSHIFIHFDYQIRLKYNNFFYK